MRHSHRVALLAALTAPILNCGGNGPTDPPLSGPQNTLVTPVPNEGWLHVPEGSTIRYQNNPPASGPHYPVWARYQEFTTTVARGYWVHNLEHGAVVFLHRPDAPAAVVDALRSAYRLLAPDAQCGHRLALLTADPELSRPIAVVAADWVLTADGVDAPTIQAFVAARRNHGAEQVCDQGTRP